MFGQIVALMTRSLREDTRLLRASLARFGVLLLIGWLLLLIYAQSGVAGAPGLAFFVSITYLNFFVISLAGISFFATTITEEKEERTLGLLKMAGVSPLAILLGKSTSRLFVAMLMLTLEVPFILLAVTLGGVLLHQVAAAYCTLLAYVLSLANVALFASVICRSSRTASLLMTILLALFFIFPPVMLGLIDNLVQKGMIGETAATTVAVTRTLEWFKDLSPFSQIGYIITTGFSDPVLGHHILVHLLAAVAMFGLSWAVFDSCTRNDEPIAPPRALPARRRRRPRRVWQPALVWKDFTFFAGGLTMLALKLVAYGLLVLLFNLLAEINSSGTTSEWEKVTRFGLVAYYVGLGSLAIEATLYAGRFLRDEAHWQTLSSVCLLPMSLKRIVYTKLLGCCLGLISALAWIVVGAVLNPDDTYREFTASAEVNPQLLLWATMFVLFVHVAAYLSLFVKWGAAPLAFVVVFIGGYLILITVILTVQWLGGFLWGPDSDLFRIIACGYLVPVPFLHLAAIRRLKKLAAQ